MLKENEIYVIQLDYSHDDCQDVLLYLYKTRESALKKFRELITEEVEYYDNEYKNYDDFEVDTNLTSEDDCLEYWWNCTCKSNFYLHTFIDLKVKEIQE